MRLWSLDPALLDRQALVALWREGLLARAVLAGRTRGYRHHPQLLRFSVHTIDDYLFYVLRESLNRGYHFDASKIDGRPATGVVTVTRGQLEYEQGHLRRKLAARSPDWAPGPPTASPFFHLVEGPVEGWERIKET